MSKYLALVAAFCVGACATANQQPPKPAEATSAEQDFFTQFQKLSDNFDQALLEYYADDAEISTLRVSPDGTKKETTLAGAEYKLLVLRMLPLAKMRGDRSTYRDVRFSHVEEGIKISAERYSTLKCYTDDSYYLVLRDNGSGAFEIAAEHSQTQPLSSCPDRDPGPLMQTVAKRYEGKLPVMADADSRLDAVAADVSGLRFHFTLVNITKNDIEPGGFHSAIYRGMVPQACIRPDFRSILDNGASLTYSYNDKNGDTVVEVSVTERDCI